MMPLRDWLDIKSQEIYNEHKKIMLGNPNPIFIPKKHKKKK